MKEASRKRVTASTDFQKIDKDIEKLLARKQRKTVSLNEEELRRDRVEEEQKTKDKVDNEEEMTEGPIFPDNAYNNELLSITVDYLSTLRETKKTAKTGRRR